MHLLKQIIYKNNYPTTKPIFACYTKDEGDIYITSEQKNYRRNALSTLWN